MPRVSFLMSNYKTPPDQLRKALDSMLAQTLPDFEAVVINDGVKDESYRVLLEYAARDPRIRLIENERNLGLPASLNKGMSYCTGTYVARMDTDDVCFPERLALQTAYMDENPEIMFSGAWADVFETDEAATVQELRPVMCPRAEYRIRLLFSGEPLLIHPTVIFRRSFLEEHGLRYSEDPQFRYTEDYEFWTRCADCGAAGILEKPVLHYRRADADSRITVRHAEEMGRCAENVQKKLLARLGIDPARYDPALHLRLLAGRKPWDPRYRKWISLLLRQNRKKKIYDRRTMRRLLHDRWTTIVYYGIAYEKRSIKRIRMFLSLYPDGYPRFFRERTRRKTKQVTERTDDS